MQTARADRETEMTHENPAKAAASSKQRILDAAFRRFAAASFRDTHLRDIAADVGVDVAYVHRSFGSKEKLFHAVLDQVSNSQGVADIPLQDIAPLLTRRLLHSDAASDSGADSLMILIHSLSDPAAAGPVGARLRELFIEPLRQKLGDRDELRAASIMSLLVGLRILDQFLRPGRVDAGLDAPRVLQLVEALVAADIRADAANGAG